ncbi:MAG: hypothetical protein QXV30_02450 [Desulfurococcaceae archaeon]
MRKRYLLTILLALMVYQIHIPILEGSSNSSDCLYLLALLDIVLDHAIKGDSTGELMAQHLVNATVSMELRDLHVKTYRAIIDYYRVLHEINEGLRDVTPLLRSIQAGFDSIERYVGRIRACSHDLEAANALQAYVNVKLSTLKEYTYKLIELLYGAQIREHYSISPLKDLYSPGEVIELVASKKIQLDAVELYAWPSLVKISSFKPSKFNETHYVFKVELPPASLIESPGLTLRDVQQGLLALYLRFINNSYVLAEFVRVQYELPRVQLNSPSIVMQGDSLNVAITSDRFYNASLYFNDFEVAAMLLKPGLTNLTVNYFSLNYTTGLNRVKLCVNATIETFSQCLDRLVYIEPLYPRVRVIAENMSIAWLGYTTLLISNEDLEDLYVTVANYGERTIYVPSGGIEGIPIYSGLLPIQIIDLKVKVEPLDKSYSTLDLDLSIYVINMPIVIALIFISTLITALISGYERGFMLTIASVWRRVRQAPRGAEAFLKSTVLKPYELGLNSRIAMLYYSFLKKLKLRLPLVNETLREHYASTLHYIPEKLRGVLWKFLILVEKDLYSSKKPAYQEAEAIYRGASSIVAEE